MRDDDNPMFASKPLSIITSSELDLIKPSRAHVKSQIRKHLLPLPSNNTIINISRSATGTLTANFRASDSEVGLLDSARCYN